MVQKRLDGYRSQVTAYVFASISYHSGDQFDLGLVWSQQAVSLQLEHMIGEWAERIAQGIVEAAGSSNVSEWCKKVACWRGAQELELLWPAAAPPELGKMVQEGGAWGVQPTSVRRIMDPDEIDAQRRCRELPATDWIRIVDWGTLSGRLEPRQREIASDIAGIAAGGWARNLSGKRAKEGRLIVNIAIENGVFDGVHSV